MIKTILVPLFGEGYDEAGLELAHAVARHFSAHIEAVHVGRNPAEDLLRMTIGDGVVTKDLWDAIENDIRRRHNTARQCFDEFCRLREVRLLETPRATASASAKWSETEGQFAAEVGFRARFHELTVISRGEDENGFTPGELGDILIRSGRPILLASRTKKVPSALETIAIAWKNTAESAHMMTAAMPFIEAATKVVILTVSEDSGNSTDIDSVEQLAAELRWHGIEPEIHCLRPVDGGVEVTLIDTATEVGADLLILGGYGHSRALEFIFGGVTRYMLETADFPVFIVH